MLFDKVDCCYDWNVAGGKVMANAGEFRRRKTSLVETVDSIAIFDYSRRGLTDIERIQCPGLAYLCSISNKLKVRWNPSKTDYLLIISVKVVVCKVFKDMRVEVRV